MDKGQQFGDFIRVESKEVDFQLDVMKEFLTQIGQMFSLEQFKGLSLSDFKVEFILMDKTIAWKITKK